MGVGDPLGMAITHAICSGMGGIRAAGDLVARMQMSRGMKIDQAKSYVADKLGIAIENLSDPVIMAEVRDDWGLGTLHPVKGRPLGIEAKHRIAQLLDIEINCVKRFNTGATR